MKRRPLMISYASFGAWILGLLLLSAPARAQIVYTWFAGDIGGLGGVGIILPVGVSTITALDRLDIVTTADHDFVGRSVVNNGVISFYDGTIRGGGTMVNNAQWNDSANGTFNQAYAAWTFVNSTSGTYSKTAGTTDFNAPFTNSGTLSVTGGILNLNAGGTFNNSSVSNSSGSGVLQLTGGTLTATGTITANNFVFNGGNFAGDQTITGSAITWTSGTWNSANTTTLAASTQLTISSSNTHDLPSHSLINNGTVIWTNGDIRMGFSGGVVNNAAWNDSANSQQVNSAYGGGATFTNASAGTYLKTTGTTNFNMAFTNAGRISVTGGILNLNAGGTFTTGSIVGSTGTGLLQLVAGTLTMTGSITANNFVFNGGNFAGDQSFTPGSTIIWQNGTWNSANTTTLSSGSTLSILTSAAHDLPNHTLINNGTVAWTNGDIRLGFGGGVVNNAAWNDSANSQQLNSAYGGGAVFNNAGAGVYLKTAGTTDVNMPFTNSGKIQVTGGALNLNAGGTFTTGSIIGSTGSGLLQLAAGTLTMTGSITANNFVFNGGNFAGDQSFTSGSTVSWLNGTWNSANTTTFSAGSTLSILTSSAHDLPNHTLVNNGTVIWTAGDIRLGFGGGLTNNGTLNDSVSSNQLNSAYDGGASLINGASGLYKKISGTTDITLPLINSGTVSATGGTLNLAAGGTFNDGSSIGSSGSGVVQLTAGVLTGSGSLGFTGNNFLLTGGQVSGNLTFLGTTSWLGANFNTGGIATIGATGTFTITGGSAHDFSSHVFVNNGIVNWSNGDLRTGSGGGVTNNGTWNDTAANNFNDAYGGATFFTNGAAGSYLKTSAGTTTFTVPMTNSGLIKVTSGLLALTGGLTNTNGSIALASGGTLTSASSITFGTGSLSGVGTLNTPSASSSGQIAPGLPGAAGQLTVNGNLSLLSTAQPTFEIGGTTQGTQYDFLLVNGTLTAGGTLGVSFIGGFNTSVTSGMTFTLINATNILLNFANVGNGGRLTTSDGFGSFVVNYGAGSAFAPNTLVLSSYLAVPEPSTWALMATGGAFLVFATRRRKK